MRFKLELAMVVLIGIMLDPETLTLAIVKQRKKKIVDGWLYAYFTMSTVKRFSYSRQRL